MKNYIQYSNQNLQHDKKEYLVFGKVFLYIKDPLVKPIDIPSVITKLRGVIPKKFVNYVDEILVGNFPQFAKKKVNASYEDGAIYVTNVQSSEKDMLDDIVHEWGHAVETNLEMEVYGDGSVEKEFLAKSKWLYFLLKEHGFAKEEHYAYFANPEYSQKFDLYLYGEVGYDGLNIMTAEAFLSPYAITSLREYFADAFEEFFLNRKRKEVRDISPALYNKFEEIMEESHGF